MENQNHLECPICYEILNGSFVSCKNKHTVCIRCFMNDKVLTCPMCRDDYKKPEKQSSENIDELREEIQHINSYNDYLEDRYLQVQKRMFKQEIHASILNSKINELEKIVNNQTAKIKELRDKIFDNVFLLVYQHYQK